MAGQLAFSRFLVVKHEDMFTLDIAFNFILQYVIKIFYLNIFFFT